jgi:hypothetical protein
VIIDQASGADPTMLTDLTEHAAQQQARIVLLDTTMPTWPPQPSAQILQLLRTDLPWSTTIVDVTVLAAMRSRAARTAPDLEPVLNQADRLHPELLTPSLRQALNRRTELRQQHRRAYHVHHAGSWIGSHDQSAADVLPPHPGLDI